MRSSAGKKYTWRVSCHSRILSYMASVISSRRAKPVSVSLTAEVMNSMWSPSSSTW